MAKVRALVLRSPGANCDAEAVFALELAGAAAERLHINRLREHPAQLSDFQILLIPGGFTYGDDVAAGKILAHQLRHFLGDALKEFRDQGKLILGICNGFQALIKSGLLVEPLADGSVPATLTYSVGGFQDRWVKLRAEGAKHCPFLAGYGEMLVPIAHGEGRFYCKDEATLAKLRAQRQLVLIYVPNSELPDEPYNPNGSQADVAGICDTTGRVLGLMPHPERHALPTQHPHWTRTGLAKEGDGLRVFRNAVEFFKN